MTTTTRNYDRSIAMHAAARESLAGGVNSNFRMGGHPVPLFFTRGAGAHLWDVDGNDYIDYVLGMGPNILGHAPPVVVDAVAETLGRGNLFAGQHEDEVSLAVAVQEAVPCADLVRFGMSGSEMDQAAIRLARAATGRPLIVKFEGHYHGWFDTVLVSTAPPLAEAGPYDAPTKYYPSPGQSHHAADDLALLPWNDLDVLTNYVEAHHAEIAGILMEPILCNTCVIMPRPGYLEGVRALCDRYGIVLIFDEVITGFRVALGGAQARLGVTPDLAVFAKALGGGYPVAALAGKRELMELLGGAVLHGGSYNANTVSTVAALVTLRELGRDGGDALYAAMEAKGERLMAGIRDAAADLGVSAHVQGVGQAFNVSFGHDAYIGDYRDYARTDLAMQRRFNVALQENGVRVTSRGTWFLSAVHTDADIDGSIAAARAALRSLQ